jgi:hypothetical protein
VDPLLSTFIEELKLTLKVPPAQQQQQEQQQQQQEQPAEPTTPDIQQRASQSCSCSSAHSHQLQPCAAAPPALLPPQQEQHRGRLTVLLDLDGTLVSSFTPRRQEPQHFPAVGFSSGCFVAGSFQEGLGR